MRVEQEKVRLFHEKYDYPTADTPTLASPALQRQRWCFIKEELDEYVQACFDKDLTGIADALADLVYVVLGTAVVHGINLEPIFNAVHVSNMTKTLLDPVTKKGGKGPGYQPPKIAELLLVQTTKLEL